ncbi:SLAM family member 6, partial [Galemys pyrenaicus]
KTVLQCISDTQVIGVLGESVILPLNISNTTKVSFITWIYNDTSVIFIQGDHNSVTDPKWINRIHVTKSSHSIQLSELNMTDSGHYKAQVTTDKMQFFCYTLRIFRRMSNLYVTNHTQRSENKNCEVYLTCSVENPDDGVSVRWQVAGNIFLKESLTLYWNFWNSSEQSSCTCVAENPVSNISSSVSLQSLCE